MPYQLREKIQRGWFDDELMVLGREALRQPPRMLELGKFGFTKADRECAHGRREGSHRGDHGARIDATRQERPQRHIRDEPPRHRAGEKSPELGDSIAIGYMKARS